MSATQYKKGSFFLLLLVFGLISLYLKLIHPSSCANSISCIKNLGVQIDNESRGIFHGQKIEPPKINLLSVDLKKKVLGEKTTSVEKHIYVDLTKQTLYAYEGDKLFMQTLISSGKWSKTPIGDFRIWVKLRATRMTGGEGADFYDLPNVPYVMFFGGTDLSPGRGFSLHGAYWHNNFGHPMSHGCINMRIVDAQKLYDWVNPVTDGYTTYEAKDDPGTPVTIFGEAPI